METCKTILAKCVKCGEPVAVKSVSESSKAIIVEVYSCSLCDEKKSRGRKERCSTLP